MLKPVSVEQLQESVTKWQVMCSHYVQQANLRQLEDALNLMQRLQPKYRDRFLITGAEVLESIQTRQIGIFQSRHGLVKATTFAGRSFAVEESLERLATQLDPQCFFQVNRNMIVQYEAIQRTERHFIGRLRLHLSVKLDDPCIVSKERVARFRAWLDGR